MRNPWLDLPESPPFILAADSVQVSAYNQSASEVSRIHVELLPEPFLGDPNAPVLILGLNPGFSPDDTKVHSTSEFASLSRANLRHEMGRYPFYLLNPAIDGPGRKWWERRLARILDVVPREVAARRILCVEYFPYHSGRFKCHRLQLSSQQYAFHLVRKAIRRQSVVILMRSQRLWISAVPELGTYERLFKLVNPRCASISRNNCPVGFDAVLRTLGDTTNT